MKRRTKKILVESAVLAASAHYFPVATAVVVVVGGTIAAIPSIAATVAIVDALKRGW